jgi:hypothetical protein
MKHEYKIGDKFGEINKRNVITFYEIVAIKRNEIEFYFELTKDNSWFLKEDLNDCLDAGRVFRIENEKHKLNLLLKHTPGGCYD